MNGARGLLVNARPGWPEEVSNLLPGAHVAVLADDADVGIEGRLAGLEFRDTILVLRPGPRSSYCFLFRVPLAESTVAEQMMATGTGGLNINACRVGYASETDRQFAKPEGRATSKPGALAGKVEKDGARKDFQADNTKGRWPANLVLVHGSGCKSVGTKRVHGSHSTGVDPKFYGEKGRTAYGTFDGHKPTTFVGDDGMETVAAYECEDGCPVKLLDEQSGELSSGEKVAVARRRGSTVDWRYKEGGTSYGDMGGASRFYPQFKDDAALVQWVTRLIGGGSGTLDAKG